jgi:tetratricopeptide (TPR) repeat protein
MRNLGDGQKELNLMKIAGLLFFGMMSAWIPANAINAVSELQTILAIDSYGEMNDRIRTYVEQNQGSIKADYVASVTEINANKAIEGYKKLVSTGRSVESETALLRIAQYHMARGFYITARKHYLELLEEYPESQFAGIALYQAAICLLPAGDYDNCYLELSNFLDRYPESALAEAAKADAKAIKGSVSKTASQGAGGVLSRAGDFTLQIGAFEQANNALNLRNYVAKLGHPVEIVETQKGTGKIYQVLMGSFRTEDAARRFGDNFKKTHGKLYRIVTKK